MIEAAEAQGIIEVESEDQLDRDVDMLIVPIIIFFTSPSCTACHTLEPLLERVAKKGVPLNEAQTTFRTVAVRKVNVEKFSRLAAAYAVRSLPTCLFVLNCGILDFHAGTITEDKLYEIIRRL